MTATLPAVSDLRDCRLYRFYGWDPRTDYTTKTLIYVGETVRQPFERLMEHVGDQPWADTITSWEVDDRVFAGKGQVLAAEAAAIRDEKPVYNVRENGQNQRRVIPPDAIRQRRARDAAHGRARWVHPADRSPALTQVMSDPAHAIDPRSWKPWQQRIALWSGGWIGSTSVTWAQLVRNGWLSSRTALLCASIVCSAVLISSHVLTPPRRRKLWKLLRRLVRWLRR